MQYSQWLRYNYISLRTLRRNSGLYVNDVIKYYVLDRSALKLTLMALTREDFEDFSTYYWENMTKKTSKKFFWTAENQFIS